MLARFLLALLSSWIVNPLGVLVAHFFGIANTPTVILVLLSAGACVPFQLLLNECVAAQVSKGAARPTRLQMSMIVLIQMAACAWALLGFSDQNFAITRVVGVVGLLAANTVASYHVALVFYGLVARGKITMQASMLVGCIPGLTTLALYLIYCSIGDSSENGASLVVLATAIVPCLLQWLYVIRLGARANGGQTERESRERQERLPALAMSSLVLTALTLAFLGIASTRLREIVAQLSINHVALLLVVLNSLLSIVNAITRAAFLEHKAKDFRTLLPRIALFFLAGGAVGSLLRWTLYPALILLASQVMIAWTIEIARHSPSHRSKPPANSF